MACVSSARVIRRVLTLCLCLAAAALVSLGLLYLFREPILRGAAHAWILDDEPFHADAIAILTGGQESRPLTAAKLYHAGFARRIILADIPAADGVRRPGLDFVSGTLVHEDVPPNAITIERSGVRSTRDEAKAILDWAVRNQASRLLVVTDAFHTRRARWIFSRVDAGLNVEFRVIAAPPHDYAIDQWWRSEVGLIDFQNEVIKYLYYRWEY